MNYKFSFISEDSKAATGRKTFDRADIQKYIDDGFGIGLHIPKNFIVVDIDSADPRTKFICGYLQELFPNAAFVHSRKAGGWHVWIKVVEDDVEKLKRKTGLVNIFGCTCDFLTNGYCVLPINREDEGRHWVGHKNLDDFLAALDAMPEQNFQTLKVNFPIIQQEKISKVLTPFDLGDGQRNTGLASWLGSWANWITNEDIWKRLARPLAKITGLDLHEVENTVSKSAERWQKNSNTKNIMVMNGGTKITWRDADLNFWIEGDNMPTVAMNALQFCEAQNAFQKDVATGNIRSSIPEVAGKILSEKEAFNMFSIYMADRLFIATRSKDGETRNVKALSQEQKRTIFNYLMQHSTYNSRDEWYKSIPEWDNVPRIDTFMKKYFECDAPAAFARLFFTSIVGKIKEPDKCYVDYFFDFIGDKGIGKSYFMKRLVGNHAVLMHPRSRYEDLFVELYMNNAVIAVDDEAQLVGSKNGCLSYDQWKEFITTSVDTFSRKFCDPETHFRSFIVVRTSNEAKTVFSTNERRQVVFESNLNLNECRIKDAPDSLFQQVLAEAKSHYEMWGGRYELTDEEKELIQSQNLEYYNDETDEIFLLKEYVEYCHQQAKKNQSDYIEQQKTTGVWFFTIGHFNSYCDDFGKRKLTGRDFWRCITFVQDKFKTIVKEKKKVASKKYGVMNAVSLVINSDNTPPHIKRVEREEKTIVLKKTDIVPEDESKKFKGKEMDIMMLPEIKEGDQIPPSQNRWIFDCEVFVEDWIVNFVDVDNGNQISVINDREELKHILSTTDLLIGYNSSGYDRLILQAILLGENPIRVSNAIINNAAFSRQKYNFIDLPPTYDCMERVKNISLKGISLQLGIPQQDCPIDFQTQRKLTDDELEMVSEYCFNDCEITRKWFLLNETKFFARRDLLNMYKMDVNNFMHATDATIVAKVLGATKVKRDDDTEYLIPELAGDLRTRTVREFFEQYKTDSVSMKPTDIQVGDILTTYGIGGLHAAQPNYHGTDLINVDVASLYPSLMIEYGLQSRNIEDKSTYPTIRDTRLAWKKAGDKRQEALKLVLNTTYGAMKAEWNPLYDPMMASSICVFGQILLTVLMERLQAIGCKIVQANTDGILFAPVGDYKSVCAAWEKETRLVLEFDEVARIAQRDVNNYVMQMRNGKTKAKGVYLGSARYPTVVSKGAVKKLMGEPMTKEWTLAQPLKDFCLMNKASVAYPAFLCDGVQINDRAIGLIATLEGEKWERVHKTGAIHKIPQACDKMRQLIDVKSTDEIDLGYYVGMIKELLF